MPETQKLEKIEKPRLFVQPQFNAWKQIWSFTASSQRIFVLSWLLLNPLCHPSVWPHKCSDGEKNKYTMWCSLGSIHKEIRWLAYNIPLR